MGFKVGVIEGRRHGVEDVGRVLVVVVKLRELSAKGGPRVQAGRRQRGLGEGTARADRYVAVGGDDAGTEPD